MAGIDVASLFSLTGKTALVTGGSRGIGRMMAEGLVQAGVTVYISSRRQDACDRTAIELSAAGPCHSLPADVATGEGRTALVEAIGAREPRLHILINNAGAAWGAPYAEYPAAAFDKVLRLNVAAPFLLTRDLTPLLERGAADGDPARVINVGSMDGLHVQQRVGTGTFAYSASKAAVHHLTRTLAVELGPPQHHGERRRPRILREPDDGRRAAAARRGHHRRLSARTASGGRRRWPAYAIYLASRAGERTPTAR